MSNMIQCCRMQMPRVNEKEILRYARCPKADEQTLLLMCTCVNEAAAVCTGRVCFTVLDCAVRDDVCDFGLFSVKSKDLAKNLTGCNRAVLFAATLGMEIDRLIEKYQKLSPAKAVMMQAIGAERIEAACDVFCRDLEKIGKQRPRFSPGYGDVKLDVQKDFFRILQPEKHLGLYLSESLLMKPSKSVTAFVGLEE